MYKVDVDKAYVAIRKELDQVKLENARLVSENIRLKQGMDVKDDEPDQHFTGVEDTETTQELEDQPSEKIEYSNPGPSNLADYVYYQQVTGGFKGSDKQSCFTDGKSNYRQGPAQWPLYLIVLCAAVYIYMLFADIASDPTVKYYSSYITNTNNTKFLEQKHETRNTIRGDNWEFYYATNHVIDESSSIPSQVSLPFYILCGLAMILIWWLIKSVNHKVKGMLEWNAMDMYRTTLKESGYTFRLPYKISQLGTADFPGTSLSAYKLCYTAVIAAATPITVVCTYSSALTFVLKHVVGLLEMVYKLTRGWFKPILRVIRKIVRMVLRFLTACVIIVTIPLQAILRIVMTLASIIMFNRTTATLVLVGLMYYLARVYVVGHLLNSIMQLTEVYVEFRAKLVHYVGMMTLNWIRPVQLIIAACQNIKVHGIIDTLVKKIWQVLKFK